jgi:hypothetical protein
MGAVRGHCVVSEQRAAGAHAALFSCRYFTAISRHWAIIYSTIGSPHGDAPESKVTIACTTRKCTAALLRYIRCSGERAIYTQSTKACRESIPILPFWLLVNILAISPRGNNTRLI